MTTRTALVVLICTLAIALADVANLSGQESATPVKITLHPQAAPVPSLKYRLLPTRLEQKRGNAAVHYGKVTAEETRFFSDKKLRDNIDAWQESPLAELRDGKVRLPSQGGIEDSLRRGALCMECDWLLPVGDVPYFSMLLPDVQQNRGFGRILAVRARIQIADHNYEDAVTTLQTGYTLGRHVATGETVVNGLVGIAICESMNKQIVEYVQQLGSPNLYWALSTLPAPLIDMQHALDVERRGVELTFPELANAQAAKKTPDEWRQLYERVFSKELGLELSSGDTTKWPTWDEIDKRCHDRLPAAKQYLVASGMPEKVVEEMETYQIATLYTLALCDEHYDDVTKYARLPSPEAIAGVQAAIARVNQDDREIVPISKEIVPSVGTSRTAAARLDRAIAVLRVFEALRIHAASHGDQLPDALANVTDVLIPNDPVTGKPFDYQREGDKALLRGPTFRDVPVNYEITMVPRH